MADIKPFKGLYYNSDKVDLKKVVMPPYDIIKDKDVEGYYKNGKEHGTYRLYYPYGKLKVEETYIDGKVEGLYRSYFESGKIQSEKMFVGGLADGPCNLYHENGKIKVEAVFEKDAQVVVVEYDEKGNRI